MNNKVIHIVLPAIVTLLYVAMVVLLAPLGTSLQEQPSMGIVQGWYLPSPGNSLLSVAINASLLLLSALLFARIPALFSLYKEKTLVPMMFFLLFMSQATMSVIGWAPHHLVLPVVALSVMLLYAAYQGNGAVEKSFLVSLLISVASMLYGRILYYYPLFLLGFVQMKAASWRTFAAMLVALIIPYWIVWGLGLIEFSQLSLDVLAIVWEVPQLQWQSLLPVVVVLLIGLIWGSANLIVALGDKIRMRAMNGFINIMSVYTALLMLVDYMHYTFYFPLLCASVAMQGGYFFVSRQSRIYNIAYYLFTLLLMAGVVWFAFMQ